MESKDKVQEVLMKCCEKYGGIPIVKKLQGFCIDKRFMIAKKIGQGAFGQIFGGYDIKTDLNGDKKPIVFKFTKEHEMNEDEFNAMQNIQKSAESVGVNFVETYKMGKMLCLDRALRSVKHFSQMEEEEMMEAFEK